MSGGNEKCQHVWLETVLARKHGANLHVGRSRMRSYPLDSAGSETGYNIMKCNEHHNEMSTEIFGTTDFIEQNLSSQADTS